ncbi:hypothetical protein FS837_009981 [Tulasnella sp. UAMH 9824]|nr:hypothetical protein FS837_009981 [Tulasnella sp. UAMH 9824]
MPIASRKKRVDAGIDPNNVIDGPRKRVRRSTEAANRSERSNSKSRSRPQRPTLQLKTQAGRNTIVGGKGKNPVVFEQGIKIWIAVLQATDPSGRSLAVDLLESPSKKSWPDLYIATRDFVSLKEIKNKLDHGSYPTMQAVKRDFDTMCNNAKLFSVSGSSTWVDADNVQKLVEQEFRAVTGEPAEMEVDQTALVANRAESSISKAPKTHLPVLGKLLKMRLQKLYEMKDGK